MSARAFVFDVFVGSEVSYGTYDVSTCVVFVTCVFASVPKTSLW
jgi:hypothetical protein